MKIVLASDNVGKAKEFQAILSHLPIELVSQSEFNVPPVEESGLSFIENAIIKARHAAQCTGLPAIADDSGLAVAALGGKPGIFSARFAGRSAKDEDNIRKLLADMHNVAESKRQATFYCVIAFVQQYDDPVPLICQGKWEGTLLHAPQGHHGFGYDPIFYDPTNQCSAAELSKEVKNQISHRAKALQEFIRTFEI
jgi:XTP/dITP diphosphohydrolase